MNSAGKKKKIIVSPTVLLMCKSYRMSLAKMPLIKPSKSSICVISDRKKSKTLHTSFLLFHYLWYSMNMNIIDKHENCCATFSSVEDGKPETY